MARRRFPTLTLMTIIAAGLAAWAIFVEIPAAKKDAIPERDYLLSELSPEQVTKIEASGRIAWRLERNPEGAWEIISPQPWLADQAAIKAYLEFVTNLESVTRLKKTPINLADYGLASPHTVLVFYGASNERWHLSFGDESIYSMGAQSEPRRQTYLALEGAPPVYLIEGEFANEMVKRIDDFRNKIIFTPDISSLASIEIRYQGRVTTLNRIDEVWHVVIEGENRQAEMQKVLNLVTQIYGMTIDEFSSNHAEAASYGIGPGSDYFRLVDKNGATTLWFGRENYARRYCASGFVGEIWSVDNHKYTGLDLAPFEFLPNEPEAQAEE